MTIPESVTSIGSSAFEGCSNLQYNIYDNAKYLGNAKNRYVSLIEATSTSITSVNIHSQTRVITDSAFFGCSSVLSITVANGNTRYHSEGNCIIETERKKLIVGCKNSVIPNSVTSIG